ncbi:MAG: gamma-glutamyl-gamma-aminobutyrate hydrolase family protein [Desulfatiglandaceae bacterium]
MKRDIKKPLIGVTCFSTSECDWVQNAPGKYVDAVFRDYSRGVESAGGIPVLVPVHEHLETARSVVSRLDGLLLTGGPDVCPRFFGEEPTVGVREMDVERDRMELELARQAEKRGMPILGICRGIQLMAVAFGGTIFQDIFSQVPGCLEHCQKATKSTNTHRVNVNRGTKLFEILKTQTAWVNSHHHQAVKAAPDGFIISATSGDGIVEAIEKTDYPFLMGVQWHAEGTWMREEASRKIFIEFVKTAGVGMADRR